VTDWANWQFRRWRIRWTEMCTKDRNSVTKKWRIKRWRIRQILLYNNYQCWQT